MAHGVMATRALQTRSLAVNYITVDRRGDRFVTASASVLHHLVIEFRDLNGVGIPPRSEVKRVPKAVVGLHSIFSEDVVRCVAIIAGSG